MGPPAASEQLPVAGGPVARARQQAERRRHQQQRQLLPLRLAVLALVAIPAVVEHPGIGFSGRRLAILLCVLVYALGLLGGSHRLVRRSGPAAGLGLLAAAAAAGAALGGLQPTVTAEIPVAAVVYVTASRFRPPLAAVVVVPAVAALGAVLSTGASAEAVLGAVLLCLVLAVVAELTRDARHHQERTELLLAELEAARDEQDHAAALEERSRIARELHDVLAHSLSGLSIQLEGVRRMASGEGASPGLQAEIDRAARLAKEGVLEARNAVSALRDRELLGVEQLPMLVEHYRRDLGLVVEYTAEGPVRPVVAEVGLALYRVAGEALTNVARHAPRAPVHVRLAYGAGLLRLTVQDEGPPGGPGSPRAGERGWGLIGIRERVDRLAGSHRIGPEGAGWLVDVELPT